MTKTRIGISGYSERLCGKVDCFEVDAQDPVLGSRSFRKKVLGSSTEIVLRFGQAFFNHNDPLVLKEKFEAVLETVPLVEPVGGLMSLPPKFWDRMTIRDHLAPWAQLWRSRFEIPLWIDPPAESPTRAPELASDSRIAWAGDPLWEPQVKRKAAFWKIHGWHDTRWVRKYSQESLLDLAREVGRHRPSFVIFGHSQREAQCLEFLNLIRAHPPGPSARAPARGKILTACE